jgi:HD superfamily phosphohydrolase
MALPAWLDEILLTADVQRLRGIRLINSSSPSLTSISDARRYTHTLGVIRLAIEAADHMGLATEDTRTLLAGAVCHDLATPPFGHLFEYILTALRDWTHEQEVLSILDRTYSRLGEHHQILPGRTATVGETLARHGISTEAVAATVRGQGRLGRLIAGSLDLDNIDNVFRMAHLLGMRHDPESALVLAGSLRLSDNGLALDEKGVGAMTAWAATRRRVYELLAFDPTNLKAQAMLTEAIIAAMREDFVGSEHWVWTDEQLLYKLQEALPSKTTAIRLGAGDLYETVFIGWYDQPKGEIDWRHPERLGELRDLLETATHLPCAPYVFYDRGTFSKAIPIDFPPGCSPLNSQTSTSTIVGVFTPRREVSRKATVAARAALDRVGFAAAGLQAPPDCEGLYELPGQISLAL